MEKKLNVMDLEKMTRGRVISEKMKEHYDAKAEKQREAFLRLHPSLEMYDKNLTD